MTRSVPLVVAGASFALCVFLAAPGLTWLDGGELTLAAGTLGVAHPPGEPAYIVLARLAAFVPIGDLPFRLTLLSAATVAGASGLLAAIVSQAAGRLSSLPGASVPLAGLLAGGLFACAPATVLQGVRPELYGLAVLLGLLSVRALQLGGRRGVALAVLPLCVAGAVHHAMLVAAAPGLVLLATGRGRGSLRAGLVCCFLLLGPGLLQFLYLPLRSLAEPALDFGTPQTLERIVHSVTAAGYARSFQPVDGQITRNLLAHLQMFRADLGLLVLLLASVGFVSGWRRARRRTLALLLVLGIGLLPTVLQGLFREDNPDARGYLLGPIAVLCSAGSLGGMVLLSRVRAAAPGAAAWVGTALLVALLATPLSVSLRTADHSEAFLPARLGGALLDSAPQGAAVLIGGDSWAFPPLYLRYWEGRRSDLAVHPLHMLEPAALPSLHARGFPLPARLSEQQLEQLRSRSSGFRSEHLLLLLGAERGLGGRALMVNEVFLPGELLDLRVPSGLLYRIGGGSAQGAAAEETLWTEGIEPAFLDSRYARDPFGQGVLSRRYAARSGFHRSRGELELARVLVQRGSKLNLNSGAMVQLLRWRVESGLDDRAPRPEDDAAVREASRLALDGQLAEAGRRLSSVLAEHPAHPEGRLLAERLYSLGVQASPAARAPAAEEAR